MILKNRSLSSLLLLNTALVVLVCVVASSAYWINFSFREYEKDHRGLLDNYLTTEKDHLKSQVEHVQDYLQYIRSQSEQRIKENLKEKVLQVHLTLELLIKNKKGKVPLAELKAQAYQLLKQISELQGEDYFFVADREGLIVLNPANPEIEGKNYNAFNDPMARKVFETLSQTVQAQGEGFSTYEWRKPGQPPKRHFPKVSYVKSFEPFGWVIGKGAYLDSMDRAIQKEAIQRIAQIRFGHKLDGYISLYQQDGLVLLELPASVVGQNFWEKTDPFGKKLVQLAEQLAQSKEGGFLEYHWEMPSDRQIQPKFSYFKADPTWHWIIGAGTYLNGIESTMLQKKQELHSRLVGHLQKATLVLAVLMGGILILAYWQSQKIRKEGRVFLEFLQQAKSGTAQIDPKRFKVKDFRHMASFAQEMLKAREEMLANLELARKEAVGSNQAKSEFLSTMSHELRTPLNGILGMAELMIMQDLPPQQKKYAEIIYNSGNSLLSILNDILDLSKIEAGKLKLQQNSFNLKSLVQNLAKLFSASADSNNLVLNCMISQQVPEHLEGDADRIGQVLSNLLANAIKFSHEGRINLQVSLKSLEENQAWVTFEVRDTGVGIPQGMLDSIFEPFYQVEEGSTKRYKGTGLGLAIVKRLVDLMKGQIQVSSVLGQGTCFLVTLPLALSDQPGQTQGTQASRPSGSGAPLPQRQDLKLLVVEDDSLNQRVVLDMLERMGLNAQVAENGVEALALMENQRFDLILMDCLMPRMDGYQTTEEIRKREAIGDWPGHCTIIALTAKAMKGDEEYCLAVGMDGYLSKPINISRLSMTIQRFFPNLKL